MNCILCDRCGQLYAAKLDRLPGWNILTLATPHFTLIMACPQCHAYWRESNISGICFKTYGYIKKSLLLAENMIKRGRAK